MNKMEQLIAAVNLINNTSSELSSLLGSQVEIRVIKPELPGLCYIDRGVEAIYRNKLSSFIIDSVCQKYNTTVAGLRGSNRVNQLPDARKIACFLLNKYMPGLTQKEIAEMVNYGRSMVSIVIVEAGDLIKHHPPFRRCVDSLTNKIDLFIYDIETDLQPGGSAEAGI